MKTTKLESAFFLGLLLITTAAFLWLIQGYLQPLFWAAVLAIIFNPVQERWMGVTRDRANVSSILTILTIVLIVLVPLFFVGLSLSIETVNLYQRIASGEIDIRSPVQFLNQYPLVADFLQRFGLDTGTLAQKLSQVAVTVTQWLATRVVDVGQDVVRFLIGLFVMLYVLFFFLRDSRRIIEKLIRSLPFGDVREHLLFEKFAAVARATIKGTLAIGVAQGAIGGILFWITGVTAPVFWAAIMTVLSVIPAVGASLIWVPACIYFFVTGVYWKGIVILIGGAVIISTIDNILRPIMVGKDTKMPDALVLISTLGGLTAFGISGFVTGPVIAAFFLVVWDMFEKDFAHVIEGKE